ncbi:hypothetical protein X943_001080 [Babesia divergens]|uniref:NELF-A N-terminal domain-containing protein n=1 Tax=Babesia divergens TaxID=32595 RepID=A0AAD9GJF8_BABDI|nr:hypothetical protein X943_001080 [Babesia divergens]
MRDQLFIDDVNEQHRVDSDCEFVESVDEEVLKKLSDQYVEYLKLIKDNWSSCHASKILSLDLVRYIVPRFRQLSAPLRVRILTSFFYIKDNLRIAAQPKLMKIFNYAETDANEWVRKMVQLVKPFIINGMIDLRLIDTETAFRIITFIDEHKDSSMQGTTKDGLDSIHTCNVKQSNVLSSQKTKSSSDEYTQYYPKMNFDLLGNEITRRAYTSRMR